MRRWRRFRRLAPPQRSALLWALVLVPVTGAALRVMGMRRWRAVLALLVPRNNSPARLPPEESTAEKSELARQIGRMVTAAAREGVFHGQCLEKSLVLWWLLVRQGLPAEVRIGVRRAAGKFEAHAWVELFKTAVNDDDRVRQDYAPFERNMASLEIEPR